MTSGASASTAAPRSAGFEETVAWGAEADVDAGSVVEKSNLVRPRLAPGREIQSQQSSLKALLARVASVQADCTKAETDNEMLQTYIDEVTKSLAAKS